MVTFCPKCADRRTEAVLRTCPKQCCAPVRSSAAHLSEAVLRTCPKWSFDLGSLAQRLPPWEERIVLDTPAAVATQGAAAGPMALPQPSLPPPSPRGHTHLPPATTTPRADTSSADPRMTQPGGGEAGASCMFAAPSPSPDTSRTARAARLSHPFRRCAHGVGRQPASAARTRPDPGPRAGQGSENANRVLASRRPSPVSIAPTQPPPQGSSRLAARSAVCRPQPVPFGRRIGQLADSSTVLGVSANRPDP